MNDGTTIGIDNFQRIQFDKFEKDFSFIVNGKIYKTNSFVANILSPNISKIFHENMNISYYKLNIDYEGDFNTIIDYGEMKTIKPDESEQLYFRYIMKLLGNNSEAIKFSKGFPEEISYENVIQRIQNKKEFDISFDEEITFISRNFHFFHTKSPELISLLDIDLIERIISNNELKLQDEKELFDIILKLYMISKEYSILFSYVNFLYLPTQSIQEFNENFDISDMNKSIWEKIYCRLEQDIPTDAIKAYHNSHQGLINKRYINNIYFAKKYEHIIEHLSEQCHGNVHTQNVVSITSSSIYQDWGVENVVEQDDNKNFGTLDKANSWIQFDFKERKVLLDHYTLKTVSGNYEHLKSWILEVSDDGENYTEIDRQENCDLLNEGLKTATFNVSCSTPQRFVRLKQNGQNWGGNNYLNINQIDFSGFLYE